MLRPMSITVFEHNRAAWDRESNMDSEWSRPVDSDAIGKARSDEWAVLLTPRTPVPRAWFGNIAGTQLLCLASGGGQQAPILAAAGARVVSFDASDAQLAKDHDLAKRHDLDLRCEQGDMADLSRFDDGSFDLIFHPCSNCFVPDVAPVWSECFRVLKPGGTLLAGFLNPSFYLFAHEASSNTQGLQVRYRLPFSDLDYPDDPAVQAKLQRGEALEFGHSLESLLGGQMRSGLVLVDMYEDWWADEATPLNRFSPTSIATRAIKPSAREACI